MKERIKLLVQNKIIIKQILIIKLCKKIIIKNKNLQRKILKKNFKNMKIKKKLKKKIKKFLNKN